jgi:hypothetical protein
MTESDSTMTGSDPTRAERFLWFEVVLRTDLPSTTSPKDRLHRP